MKKILNIVCILLFHAAQLYAQNKNVLFIAVDDLKPLIGAYGDETAITPNMDRLAAMGVTFTNNHCQQAVCGPSRASLLTGLYPDLTEIWDLKTLIRDKNPGIMTLPQYFKDNGYTTVGMGKIFDPRSVDKGYDEVSWSQPYTMPDIYDDDNGEPAMGSYQSVENKKTFDELKAEGEAKGLENGPLNKYIRDGYKPATEAFSIDDDGYFDGALANVAVEKIGELGKADNPFLLCVGFKKPHLPFVAPQKYWDLYERDKLPVAAFQKQAKGTIQISYHDSGEIKSYTDIPASFGPDDIIIEAKQRELIHGYYACVSYVDAQIGKLLDALDAQGLTASTTITMWGDHGWHLGDHALWCKHSNFEQATRSPLIIASPQSEKGELNDSPTGFVDLFPTLCELTGLAIPKHLQGKSLKPILDGKSKNVNDFAISQYPRAKHMGYALRNDRYRYVAWYKEGQTSGAVTILAKELYDYKKDPLETINIVNDFPDLAAQMQGQLNAFLKEIDQQKKEFKKSEKPVGKKQKIKSLSSNQGSNLLINPGFENGDEGWRTFGGCTIAPDKSSPYEGSFAMQLAGSKCGANQIVEGLKPGTTYQISAFLKTENKEAIILKVSDFGGEDVKLVYKESEYGQVSADFNIGSGVTSAKIVLQKYGEGTGQSWFDELILIEKPKFDIGIEGPSIKEVLKKDFDNKVFVGATINYEQLGTAANQLLIDQFNYAVPENSAKQSRVHPEPGKWDWEQIDAIVAMAQKNNLPVRIHGPISPQASKWARADDRTAKELEKNMTEFMTEQCKHFNGNPAVKWMDVVNETVETDGNWFAPKPGVDEWENPWTIIGTDNDKNKTPIYISKAFEIANKLASEISLVYNQHGGMEPEMWDRVKETILYLRAKGLRVDGLGWQCHLRSDKNLAFDKDQMDYFSDLIDWAHANKLDFHVTEIDYKIWDGNLTTEALDKQAEAYANILKVLLSKRSTGVVTYNTWGISDGRGKHADKFMFMFDEQANPKPAYFAVREVLQSPDSELAIANNSAVFSDDFENGNFEKAWKQFGDTKPVLSAIGGKKGSCIIMSEDKSGIKKELSDLKPNMKYEVVAWIKADAGLKSAVKVDGHGGEEAVLRMKGDGTYQKASLQFVTGDSPLATELVINRWNAEGEGQVYIDEVSVQQIAK